MADSRGPDDAGATREICAYKRQTEEIQAMVKKIWHDPVWSKVIAGAILAVGAATVAYLLNWWPRIIHSLGVAPCFLGQRAIVPHWLLGLMILFALPTVARVILSTVRRSSRDGHLDWRSYTTDSFFGLRWRWRYIGGGTPDDLATFCPHCDFQVYPQDSSPYRAIEQITYHCESCNRQLPTFDESHVSLHNRVERLIQQRLRNGTWRVANG